jgi:hypothetical protein
MPAASQHREHGGLPRPEELDRNLPVHALGCSNKRALIAAAHSHRDIHVLPVELVQPLRGVRGRSWLVDRELGDADQMIRLAEAAGNALAADTTIPPDRSSRGPRIRTPPSGILVSCGGRSMRQSDTPTMVLNLRGGCARSTWRTASGRRTPGRLLSRSSNRESQARLRMPRMLLT